MQLHNMIFIVDDDPIHQQIANIMDQTTGIEFRLFRMHRTY